MGVFVYESRGKRRENANAGLPRDPIRLPFWRLTDDDSRCNKAALLRGKYEDPYQREEEREEHNQSSTMSDSKRSFTSSSSRDEALRRTTKIVNSFLANEDLTPFREPVDWRGLELMDYTQVVKKPMDLGTIKRRLDRLQYSCAAEVAHDIRLVWKNCMRCVLLLATVAAAVVSCRAMIALIFDNGV